METQEQQQQNPTSTSPRRKQQQHNQQGLIISCVTKCNWPDLTFFNNLDQLETALDIHTTIRHLSWFFF